MIACEKGCSEIAKTLIDKGANLEATDYVSIPMRYCILFNTIHHHKSIGCIVIQCSVHSHVLSVYSIIIKASIIVIVTLCAYRVARNNFFARFAR